MFRALRRFIVPSLAVFGALLAVPSVAHADVIVRAPVVRVSEGEHGRLERERFERERFARDRIEHERIERERIERARFEEHRLACARAYEHGASAWRLRAMQCSVR